jgi:CRP-like cAMP-binding protein
MAGDATWRKEPPPNVLPFDRARLGHAPAARRGAADPGEILLQILTDLGESKHLAAGQVLFLAGEPASHMYMVASGRVESVHLSPDGRKFVSFEAQPGDVLGEASLVEGSSYPSSAEAASKAMVVRLQGETVAAVLREGGDIAPAFAQALSRRLSHTEGRAGSVVLGGLETRVAGVLLAESDQGSKVIALTHREIADRAGAARESVTQTLNQFRRDGIVSLARGAIQVMSVAKLVAIIGCSDAVRAWFPLLKLLPAACATAAACATMTMANEPLSSPF